MYGAEFIEVLNFSNEDVEGNVVGCNREGHDFQVICSAGQDAFNTSCSASSADSDLQSTPDDFMVELPIPCEEIAHLEWLSAFVANSEEKISLDDELNNNIKNNSSSNDDDDENNNIKSSHFRSSSPISVLESSSCSGKHMLLGPDKFVPGRARSKRPRPTSFFPRPITFISPASLETTDPASQLPMSSSVSFESDNFTESQMPKKKKKKLHHHADRAMSQPAAVRKCMHCEIQKTPQWRAGPMGPKTLCNACGVRYKSGRLFPEYRPAASPTFVASKHSSSHKKVLEMRIVSGETAPAPKPEFVRKIAHCLNTLEK